MDKKLISINSLNVFFLLDSAYIRYTLLNIAVRLLSKSKVHRANLKPCSAGFAELFLEA